MRRLALAIVFLLGAQAAWADDPYPAACRPGSAACAGAGPRRRGTGATATPSAAAWPPPGAELRRTPERLSAGLVGPRVSRRSPFRRGGAGARREADRFDLVLSAGRLLLERASGSTDFVNEYGPLSTLGYGGASESNGSGPSCSAARWPTTAPRNTPTGRSIVRTLPPIVRHELPRLPRRIRSVDRAGGVDAAARLRRDRNAVLDSRPQGRRDALGHRRGGIPGNVVDVLSLRRPGDQGFAGAGAEVLRLRAVRHHAADVPIRHLLRYGRLSAVRPHRPTGTRRAISEVFDVRVRRGHDVGQIERRHGRLRRRIVPARFASVTIGGQLSYTF